MTEIEKLRAENERLKEQVEKLEAALRSNVDEVRGVAALYAFGDAERSESAWRLISQFWEAQAINWYIRTDECWDKDSRPKEEHGKPRYCTDCYLLAVRSAIEANRRTLQVANETKSLMANIKVVPDEGIAS